MKQKGQILLGLLAWLFCISTFASALSPETTFKNERARYLNPHIGRFWSMDSFEGRSSDPTSLHKYLYCFGNPVNGTDPSGHFADAISFNVGAFVNSTMNAMTAVAVHAARMSALAKLNAIAMVTATTYAGALAYEDYSLLKTSTKEWIEKGKEEFRRRFKNKTVPKIVPIPAAIIPNVATHIESAQMSRSMLLTRAGIGENIRNRAKVMGKAWPYLLVGFSWDEYPFASSVEGGDPVSVSIAPVPAKENLIQGGIVGASYFLEDINPGDEFAVIVIR